MLDLDVTMIDPTQPSTNIETASVASADDPETHKIIRRLLTMPQVNLHSMPQDANILDVDLTNPENSIFIPVNCVGVMGKGLALDFKKMYPAKFEIYQTHCEVGLLAVGNPSILCDWGYKGSVVFFPTKNDWRNPSELIWIREGLIRLATQPSHTQWRKQTRNIHIPKLGCGLGGLDWVAVRKIIEQFAACMPEHEIYLYE
jgi:hypothetical protein